MELKHLQAKSNKIAASCDTQKSVEDEIITVDECKEQLSKYNLSEEQIIEIRNNMIGFVDGIFNTYLDGF